MATDPTLAEIAKEIEVLETLDAFAAELDQFTSTLAAYSGQDPAALTSDPTIAFELGQLKELAKELSSTLGDADEVLGRGPAAAAQITSVVERLDQIADLATRTEPLSGPDRLRAMGELVQSIEGIATALTGLGSLNPVIGVFLTLYGTALGSAANTAAFLQTIQDQKLDVIARTDGQNDLAEDIASRPAPPPPDPAVLAAQRQARERLEELYAERARAVARHDANELKRARDHCARTHRAKLDAAAKEASRLDFRGHLTADGMDGDAAGALEDWLASPQPGMAEALAAASQQADADAAGEVAARAREVMQIRGKVAALMRDYLDCVDTILEHGYHVPSATAGGAASGTAMATAGAAGMSRGRLALLAAGVVVVAAVGIPMLGRGGDSPSSPSGTEPAVVGAEPADATCPGAGERAGAMTLSSAVMQDGGTIPEPYRSSSWEQGLLSPPLSWTGVPEGATELGVLVMGSNQPDFADVGSEPDPWAYGDDVATEGSGPLGDRRWVATGIDPSLDGLPAMSYQEALDAGITLTTLGASSTLAGSDEWISGFFISPMGSSDVYLFTVFALCDPNHDSPGAYHSSWFRRAALDYAWFTVAAG